MQLSLPLALLLIQTFSPPPHVLPLLIPPSWLCVLSLQDVWRHLGEQVIVPHLLLSLCTRLFKLLDKDHSVFCVSSLSTLLGQGARSSKNSISPDSECWWVRSSLHSDELSTQVPFL